MAILSEKLVPYFLCVYHLTRDEAIDHKTAYSTVFFGQTVQIIWDGTYFYINKSSDHSFQRASYSGQKHRHLLKFMSMCLPDGYCLDIRGPFYENKNDASISDYIVSTKKELEGWCENDDVMICDRANQLVPKLEQCIRITAAALNKYRGAIVQNKNSEEDKKLAELMKSYVAQNNTLLEQVASGKLSARQRWLRIDSTDFDFPEMDLDDLRKLFFGCYQIKQTTTYAEEHLDVHGDFAIQVSRERDDITRCAIKSRHSNAVKYYVWIEYSFTGKSILSWYCQCKTGARTASECAHIAMPIRYLAYARHNDFSPAKGRQRIKQAIEELQGESDSSGTESD
ncbi:unnamed protein product [Didymodactylos carnosus]|uniref:DDE Tnp4 domain-containing protein n=1 Tax=Didymodactylos carnosus TaxID=1234261 RepID=A0A8S2RE54_9BILA|nr:unnamed protein product [Didymodactylos carnosus]CAF4160215.1 unnamed protein product [Didymodactylos carnosus]